MINEILGLSLNADGTIGICGHTLPQEIDLPAVQLGEWTVSKLAGRGRSLNASRGDGFILRFEFDNGKWFESESDANSISRPNKRRGNEQKDESAFIKGLEWLASIPYDEGHLWEVVDGRGSAFQGSSKPEYREGELALYRDGTVVLGSVAFPPGTSINGYRFGQSVAYRCEGRAMLVVAGPGGVRWFLGESTDSLDFCEYGRVCEVTSSRSSKSHTFFYIQSNRNRFVFSDGTLLVDEDGVAFVRLDGENIERFAKLHPKKELVTIRQIHFLDGNEGTLLKELLRWSSRLVPFTSMNIGKYIEIRPGEAISFAGTFSECDGGSGTFHAKTTERYGVATFNYELSSVQVYVDGETIELSQWPLRRGCIMGYNWFKFSPFLTSVRHFDASGLKADKRSPLRLG